MKIKAVNNLNKFLNTKLFKSKSRLIALGLAGAMALSFAGCGKEETKEEAKSNDSNPYSTSQFDKDFNEFSNNMKKGFYLNSDDLKTSLTILNIDYILTYNPDIIKELYPNGLNSDKEMKDFESFISKYREYNLSISSSKDFINISDYATNEDDKVIIGKLENIIKELIDLVKNNGDKNRINDIFKLMDVFFDGKDITLDGEIINKDDLSNGFNLASEVFGQLTSVYTKNIVNDKARIELDNKLKSKDRRSRVVTLLETFGNTKENIKNTYINSSDTYILDEEDKKTINQFEETVKNAKKELDTKNISLTMEEINALVLTRNIDYLASDMVDSGVLKTIIDSKETQDILDSAKSAVNKIENYNMSQNNTKNLYQYRISMNEKSEEQIVNDIAIRGALSISNNLKKELSSKSSENEVLANSNIRAITLYNGYSSDVSISSNNIDVTKNDTGFGTRYITDIIYLNSMKNLIDVESVNSIRDLINDSNKSMSSIESISLSIENKCSEYEYVK